MSDEPQAPIVGRTYRNNENGMVVTVRRTAIRFGTRIVLCEANDDGREIIVNLAISSSAWLCPLSDGRPRFSLIPSKASLQSP